MRIHRELVERVLGRRRIFNANVYAAKIMNTTSESMISQKLRTAGPFGFSAWCIAAAFITYFCMYAFRKPFTAGTFEGTALPGTFLSDIGYKTILVTAQITGYTLSKFLGIKFVSEMPASRRVIGILTLIGIAELTLLLFAVTPPPWNFVWLFFNGLALGMVFGLVLSFASPVFAKKSKTRFYDFSDQLIDGEVKKPSTMYIDTRMRAKFQKLLSLKKSFRQAMIDSSKEPILK